MARRRKSLSGGATGGLVLVGVVLLCCAGLCGIGKNNNPATVSNAPTYLTASPTLTPKFEDNTKAQFSSGGNASTHLSAKPSLKAETEKHSGASAKCGDGSLSYSASRRGACSHHGGVSEWY